MTLASLTAQLNPEDAVVVISEEKSSYVQDAVRSFSECIPGPDWTYLQRQGGNWGHTNRNHVLERHVHTTHVWSLDDDDIATDTALKSLRERMGDPWTVFRMSFKEGHFANGLTIWREKKLQHGDIGTPMIFAPLGEARFGEHYSGDFTYAEALMVEHGEPVWSEEVVALIRPSN